MRKTVEYNDFSRYIKTSPLLKSSFLLSGESAGALVSLTKPSIRGLYAFGNFGRLHNLLYDLDCVALYSDLYGIYPYYRIKDRYFYPFRCGVDCRSSGSFDVENGICTETSEKNASVGFRDIPAYEKDMEKPGGRFPRLEFRAEDEGLRILAEFPPEAEECFIHLPWYPLYDLYDIGNGGMDIQYYRHGFYPGVRGEDFSENIGERVILSDSLSRQASAEINAPGCVLRMKACTVKEMGYALYLSTDAVSKDKAMNIEIKFKRNSVTFSGEHFYNCGNTARVTLSYPDGREETGKFRVPEKPGAHHIDFEDGSRFCYCAVPNSREMIKKAADACLKIFWRDGGLAGAPPYAFDPLLLKPKLRNGFHYCSHGMRSLSILCAEGVLSGDVSYIDAALRAVKSVAALSFRDTDGAIFTPLSMDDKGSAGAHSGASRPSDTGIIIRGLCQACKGYLNFGMEKKAKECAVLARDYAKTIERMQCPDGSFYDRYEYPTFKPTVNNKGTVNNWCLQLWRLIPLLKYFGMNDDADRLLVLIKRYIAYQTGKKNSIFYVSGGGEDASDFGDALNTDSTLFTIQYLLTGEEKWKEYAEQALKKAWLMSCMRADMPQFFSVYGNSDLGTFYDQPYGLFSAGGMHDLTAVEANLFAAEALGSRFAADNADALRKVRLGSFIADNGGMYMVLLQCPNYFYKDEQHSEMLMYGGVGVYAWAEAERNSDVIRHITKKYSPIP